MFKKRKIKRMVSKFGGGNTINYIVSRLVLESRKRVKDSNIISVRNTWMLGSYTLDEAIDVEIEFINQKY